MEIIMQIITVMAIGAVFFWGGIPAALAFEFPLFMAGIVTAAGAEAAVLLILVLGRPLQKYVLKRFPAWEEKTKKGKVGAVWQKYGMPGLGIIAPLFPGAPQGALFALVLSVHPIRVLFWISLGIVLWTSIISMGLYLGYSVL